MTVEGVGKEVDVLRIRHWADLATTGEKDGPAMSGANCRR